MAQTTMLRAVRRPEARLLRRTRSSLLDRLRPGAQLARLPVFRRLLMLGLLGVLLTLSVASTALVSLADVGTITGELGAVSRAQRHHQDGDMMHDALRADVARAQQAGSGRRGIEIDVVRRETARHAAQFRDNLAAIRSLSLPAGVTAALEDLRPAQQSYIASAERLVLAATRGGRDTEAARARYEAAFHRLTPAQATVTERLADTVARTEQAARSEERAARRMVTLASSAALVGWLALVVWLCRSVGNLRAALVREAEQRAVVDLLQRSLLPRQLPAVPGITLAARSLPGESGLRVGGDWYDVLALPSGEVGLVVGDVVGHDLPAATAMGELRNTLRAYALDDASPAAVLGQVNRAAHLLEVADMATCLYAVLDPSTLRVRWATAGHLPPLLSAACGTGRLLCADPGPPLGALANAEYRDHELQLEPGDSLVLYTDGLVERRGTTIDAGLACLEAVRGPSRDPEAMCDGLLTAQLHDSAHTDDVTLLLLQTAAAGRSLSA